MADFLTASAHTTKYVHRSNHTCKLWTAQWYNYYSEDDWDYIKLGHVPVITERRVINPSAHSGIRVSSTSLTSLYFGVHADEEDKTEFMFDSASVEYIKKETV